ncbi:YigZ family protein [Desulfoscipio sp. XC116]|uniref:YigZ family protein n=1 Tax=Desulfoscipio sp. XC116 TaxID=3144975 RepID=UPI00325AE7F2
MKNNMLTIAKPAQAEIIIKKSRFIASACPVENERDAINFVSQIRKEHSQANHNVYAYVINEQSLRCSDDGEPAGTAGKPVLEVIRHKGLSGIALVVTRYFGGILLGAGGLVRAYKETAVQGIEAAGIVERTLYREINITMDYTWLGTIKREMENNGGRQVNISYAQRVHLQAYLLSDKINVMIKRLQDLTAAQIEIVPGEYLYL